MKRTLHRSLLMIVALPLITSGLSIAAEPRDRPAGRVGRASDTANGSDERPPEGPHSGSPAYPRAVPAQIAFQGFLTDDQGSPIDTNVSLDVALYNMSEGGPAIWSESHANVTVNSGVFEIALGSVVALDPADFDGSPLFLGVSVNGESQLARTQLLASPFAMRAEEANHALIADTAIVADDGDWSIAGSDVHHATGKVGIGTVAPSEVLEVAGVLEISSISSLLLMRDESDAITVRLDGYEGGNGSALRLYDSSGVETVLLDASHSGLPGAISTLDNGSGNTTVRFDAHNAQGAGEFVLSDSAGVAMVEMDASEGGAGGVLRLYDGDGDRTVLLDASHSGGPGAIVVLYDDDGTEGIRLDANDGGHSTIRTDALTINGADVSEGFEVRPGSGAIEPGTVVCIAPNLPGVLVVASGAYDRRVAGVISGAGGIRAGLLMGQEGTAASGETPVALTGRVYVKADASYGEIRAGDFLTTSPTPGHAMKAADHAKAQGAILGKAMSALERGRGHVLVLISLQ